MLLLMLLPRSSVWSQNTMKAGRTFFLWHQIDFIDFILIISHCTWSESHNFCCLIYSFFRFSSQPSSPWCVNLVSSNKTQQIRFSFYNHQKYMFQKCSNIQTNAHSAAYGWSYKTCKLINSWLEFINKSARLSLSLSFSRAF